MKSFPKKSQMPLVRQLFVLCGLIVLLAIPTAIRAQYNFTTNNGAITITGYTGSGGAVIIPDYINSLPVIGIGTNAFFATATLTNVTFGTNILSLGNFAFENCSNLASVTINAGATNISVSLFQNCVSLTSITLPNTVTKIGTNAFYNCISLANVTLPNSITNIANTAFAYCGSLSSVLLPTNLTSIGTGIFQNCSNLTSVGISNKVTSIGISAFANCANLSSILLPTNLTTISSLAFQGCTSLTNITLPTSLNNFIAPVFLNCSSLTAINVNAANNAYSSVAGVLFNKNQTILVEYPGGLGGSYIIPNSVTNIGTTAFENCLSLTDVSISNRVSIIGLSAFQGCTSLTSITNLGSINNIANNLFFGCYSLTNVTIPNSVTNIGVAAFENCSNLTSLTIPGNVVSLGQSAFQNCTGMTNITIPNSVTNIGLSAFQNCTNLISVTNLGNISSIPINLFFGCSSLTNLTISGSVTSIGQSAFQNCTHLANIIIPSNVTNIGISAFNNCTNLKAIYFQTNAPTLGNTVFLNDSAKVYYLAGATGWGATFGGMVTVLDTVTVGVSSTNGPAPLTVTFSAASVDSAANPISSWNWDFGDGNTSTGQNPVHTYTAVGSYSPVLTATNSLGLLISVTNPPITANIVIPFTYVTNGNIITLTSYTGTNGVATIPGTLNGWPVTGIGYQAFNGPGLTNVFIPNSVTNIATNAFYICTSLTNITVDAANPVYSSLNGVLFDKAQLSLIAFPSGLNGSYTVPNSVTNVGPLAFAGCGLTNVIIPGSVTNIGADAFESCTSLNSAYFQGNAPSDLGNAFLNDSTIVYYLAGATGWAATFGGMVTVLDTVTVGVSSTNGPAPLTVTFSAASVDSATNPISGWNWDFGDGNTSTDQNPAHTYTAVGSYSLVLTATNSLGLLISVTNPPITATVVIPFTYVTNGNSITLTGYTGTNGVATIPATLNGWPVTGIGYQAFNGPGLTNVFIPNSVTNIATNAFYICTSLTNITVDAANPVYSSLNGVLFDKAQLSLIAFPSGLNGSYTVPNSVTNVGPLAFAGCGLTNVIIPSSATNIGAYAFQSSPGLIAAYFQGNAPPDVGNAFFNDSTTVYYLAGTTGWGATFGGASVVEICPAISLFPRRSPPPNLLEPGTAGASYNQTISALYGAAPYVFSVSGGSLPPGLSLSGGGELTGTPTTAGAYDFTITAADANGCTGGLSYSINVATAPPYTFVTNNNAITITRYTGPGGDVTIPGTINGLPVTSIGAQAFFASSLTSVSIPDSVTSIGAFAFLSISLTAINVGANNPSFSSIDGVLFDKGHTTMVECPIGLHGGYTVPNGVTSIPDNSFIDCYFLTSITIPDSTTTIGSYAFYYCSRLTNINVNANNPSYSSVAGVLFNKIQTTLVHYPDGLGGSYTIPNGVTSIGDYAFLNNPSLNSITIPNGVTSIGYSAFAGCQRLGAIFFQGNAPSVMNSDVFAYIAGSATLFYLPGTTGWGATFCGIPTEPIGINFSANVTNGLVPLAVNFTSPGADSTGNSLTGWKWSFGDGSSSTAQNPSHIYTYPGTFSPSVTVTNNLGIVELGIGPQIVVTQMVTSASDFSYITENNAITITGYNGTNRVVNIPDTINGLPVAFVMGFGNNAYVNIVTIPGSVNSLWSLSFDGCTSLAAINVYANNSYYSSVAGVLFNYDQTTLIEYPQGLSGSYIVPSSVTSIGQSAFDRCSSLTGITIPNGVTSIGNSAFNQCTGLTSVTLPNSITSFDGAFSYCTSLTNFTIPDSVTSIGYETFWGCTSLKTVTIPNTVTSIGKFAFYGCTSLTNLTIPGSVTSIGQNAFLACFSLTSLVMPNSITYIGANAFEACIGLKSIYFQGNAPSADSSVFYYDTGTVYYLIGNTGWGATFGGLPTALETISFNASSTNGLIPFVVNFSAPALDIVGNPLTRWNWDFGDGGTSTNQNPVHTYNSPGTFSPTLVATNSLGYGISGVGPQIVDYQPVTDFTYTINNGNVIITGYTGTNKVVTIPSSIYGLPVTMIGYEAFYGSGLTSVTIPDSVTTIFGLAFNSCANLTNATLSTNLTIIYDQAFSYTSLASINIPASVTSIGSQAFDFCQSLTNITVAEDNLYYSSLGGVLFNKTQTTLLQFPGGIGGYYNIPASVQTIGGTAFYDCSRLSSVTIPNSVTNIGGYAFVGSGLTTITIPGSVTSIGDYAFDGIFLTSVYFEGNAPPDDGTIFRGDTQATVFYLYGTTGWGSTFGGAPAVLLNPPNQPPATDASNFIYTTNYGVITITGYNGTNVNVVIPSTINGMAVTGVGQKNSLVYVFLGTGVISVIIPSTVTSIGQGAFVNTVLTNIIIPNSVKSIGDYAFMQSRLLSSISIGTNVTTIGNLAFASCSGLLSVNFPDSVTNLASYAFAFCTSLKSVTLGANLIGIGEASFAFCRNLTNINVNASNPAYGSLNGVLFDKTYSTLIQCPAGLSGSYTIPAGVSSIRRDAFGYCSSLTVTIPASVTSIEPYAFEFCTGISAYFQGNAPLNDGTAFSGIFNNNLAYYLVGTTGWGTTYGGLPTQPQIAPGFNYAATNGSVSITGYSSTNSAVVIPDTLFGLPVTSVAARAFANVNFVTSVSITPNVTSIGDGAFAGTGLNNVSISSNVTAIGNEVFMNCTSLTNITVATANPSYSSAGGVLFDKAQFNLIQFPTGLSGNYIIPNGVTNVGDYSFTYSGLTNVTIPATVTRIGTNAFYGCAGLTTVFIPAGVTSIGDQAFANCTSLTNITVDAANPDYSSVSGALLDKGQTTLIQFPAGLASLPTFAGVTSVGVSALAGCVNLTTMVIPEGIQIIGDPVFYNCTNLTSISIPASVTTIGLNAFANCTKLTNIIVDAANPNFSSVNGVLFDKAQTILIQFPAGLGGGYTVPNTVTSIGDAAFNGCPSLTSVSIGSNVASIGAAAFAYCTRLTNITVSVSNPKYSSSGGVLFDKLQKTLIGFPAGLTGSYKIPASVTNIADQAFAGGNLTSLTLSANVLSIGDESFADCPDLDAVYFLGNAPASDLGTAFAGDNNFVHVYYLPGATGLNSGSFGGAPTVLWNPQKQAPGMVAGNFKFAIAGPANGTIVIEACTNLINPVWQPVGTNVLDENGNSIFTDSQWKTHSGRYYRFRTP